MTDSPPEYNGNDWITDPAFTMVEVECWDAEVRTGQRLATIVLLAAVLTVAGLFLWGVL